MKCKIVRALANSWNIDKSCSTHTLWTNLYLRYCIIIAACCALGWNCAAFAIWDYWTIYWACVWYCYLITVLASTTVCRLVTCYTERNVATRLYNTLTSHITTENITRKAKRTTKSTICTINTSINPTSNGIQWWIVRYTN